MTLPTGSIAISQIKSEFPSINSNSLNAYYGADEFNDVIPTSGTISMNQFHGVNGRSATIYPGSFRPGNATPTRYGYGQANRTGYWHPESMVGATHSQYGTISRTNRLIGNNDFCGLVVHKPWQGTTFDPYDIHVEIYTKSSSNSGWTTLKMKTLGAKAFGGGSVTCTLNRTSAAHFGAIAGTSPTTYAWTFVTGSNINWDSQNGRGHGSNAGSAVTEWWNAMTGLSVYNRPFIQFS